MTDNLDDIAISIQQDYDVLPEGVYNVIVSNIIKGEAQKYDFKTKSKLSETEVVLKFEYTVLDGEYEGRKLFQTIRPKLAAGQKPSNLYKVWCAIEGKKFSKEEFTELHISQLLNRVLKVVTENKTVGDRIFSNIVTYYSATPIKGVDEDIVDALEEKEKKDKK